VRFLHKKICVFFFYLCAAHACLVLLLLHSKSSRKAKKPRQIRKKLEIDDEFQINSGINA